MLKLTTEGKTKAVFGLVLQHFCSLQLLALFRRQLLLERSRTEKA